MGMHSINIPIFSLDEVWQFKPINTLQQKNICKILIESADNYSLFKETVDKVIIKCLDKKHRHKYNNITLLDKLIILLKLRCSSIGWEVELETERDGKRVKFNYSFLNVLENAAEIAKNIKPCVIEDKSIKLICNIPSSYRELALFEATTLESFSEETILPYFIEKIIIQGADIHLSSLDTNQQLSVVSVLPVFLIKKIQEYMYNILNTLSNIIFYKVFDTTINFNIFGKTYAEYIKFIFEEDLYNLYQETYILTKHANMAAAYVDKLTALERNIFISLLKQENQTQESSSEREDTTNITNIPGNDIDSLDIYKQEKGG